MHYFFLAVLLIAGLMVGNEFAVGVFVHPALRGLPDSVHAPARQSLARLLGRVMPLWYAANLLLAIALTVVLRGAGIISFSLALTSAILWAMVIVFTITVLVPINNEIGKWDLENLPANWKARRLSWDRLHLLRIALLTVAFGLEVASCLS